jgi:hypothetical protein
MWIRMLLVVVLLTSTVLCFSGCASSDDTPEQRAKENAGVAGAGPGESRLNEHGAIAW